MIQHKCGEQYTISFKRMQSVCCLSDMEDFYSESAINNVCFLVLLFFFGFRLDPNLLKHISMEISKLKFERNRFSLHLNKTKIIKEVLSFLTQLLE